VAVLFKTIFIVCVLLSNVWVTTPNAASETSLVQRAYASGEEVGVNPPPLSLIFYKTLLHAQRRLIVFAYFLLVNLST